MKNILCFFGLHSWLHVFDHPRADHYRCSECDKYRRVHY